MSALNWKASQQQKQEQQSAPQSNIGTITNLMATDASQVGELGASIHEIYPTLPIQLIGSICLLYNLLGWSAIVSIVVMVALIPLNVIFASIFTKAYKRIMDAADDRIKLTTEVLENIKVLKYLAWDRKFCAQVDEKRRVEVATLRYRFLALMVALSVWRMLPLCTVVVSFLLYTTVQDRPLVPSVAFTALSLFGLLRVPLERFADLTSQIQQSRTSIERVDAFLQEAETGKYEQLRNSVTMRQATPFIGFRRATSQWTDPSRSARPSFRLTDLEISFQTGITLIVGPTGSGKTSMLMALLGEMHQVQGSVHLPGGYAREHLKTNPETGLTESVAYCAQEAWLLNDSIKQNIVFGSGWDEHRYHAVLLHSALMTDLAILPEGEQTLVGEKGMMLSGGQKQRISLARAMYSNSRYVLLDDCLSAVDSHTADHILQSLCDSIMSNRTIVMVTNNESLCIPRSNQVVMMAEGRVAAQGPPTELADRGLIEYAAPSSPSSSSAAGEERPGSVGSSAASSTTPDTTGPNEATFFETGENDGANVQTEKQASGALSWRVVRLYLTSMGPWYFIMLIPFAYAIDNIAQILVTNRVRVWSNSYAGGLLASGLYVRASALSVVQHFVTQPLPLLVDISGTAYQATDTNTRHDVHDLWYAGIYVVFAAGFVAVGFATTWCMFTGSLNASRRLHSKLLRSILGAKLKFIDSTSIGQIMNRFSRDFQVIDQLVINALVTMSLRSLSIVSIIVLISLITPIFLVPAAFLCIAYGLVALLSLRTSRNLKRLEAVQRSPIHQQFGETLRGVVTIRAYGDEARFIRDNEARVNAHTRPFLALWACTRWLVFRFDLAGALVACSAGAFIIRRVQNVDPGAAGLSLTYALSFNEVVRLFVRSYAEFEQYMNHVERIGEFIEIEQEAWSEDKRCPPSWPSKGEVRFQDYSTRYRDDLDFVLSDLNLTFCGGEKIGIVGRTGAGKSSIALAIIRGLEADRGKILFDDVDISSVGIRDLRESVTIVPQDPTVFAGTLRSNLDPFELYTDKELLTVLDRVQLLDSQVDFIAHDGTKLSSEAVQHRNPPLSGTYTTDPSIEKGTQLLYSTASHLSLGQRQLVCLARALLKDSRLLIMDEATASIDNNTDSKLQRVLRELENTTIITIAHRLHRVVDYDKVLVLDRGRVVEFDSPWRLLAKENGVFRGMCEKTGRLEGLMAVAEVAEGRRTLVQL
jgi:ABC-type multidrug transport system fused ATPase/permease subunit